MRFQNSPLRLVSYHGSIRIPEQETTLVRGTVTVPWSVGDIQANVKFSAYMLMLRQAGGNDMMILNNRRTHTLVAVEQ